jgi:5-(carboxyamino)imidazole ribonucleotide synthase
MDDSRPTLGIVGGGQLARMCWQAAIGLDVDLRVLAARADDAAPAVMTRTVVGAADDPDALRRFAAGCDVLTLDHELVDTDTLAALESAGRVVRPGTAALRHAQDKAVQRRAFAGAGLPVPSFVVTADLAAAESFATRHGWPIVCKRPRGGYDGRGVWRVEDGTGLAEAWAEAGGDDGVDVLVERCVPIVAELAVVVARRPGGRHAVAPVVETVQRDGMLRELFVPARVPDDVQRAAADLAARVVELVGAVGICAVELFWTGDGLQINEIATRPHNSGHWTIDGAATSQFENHLRAVLDLPLGAMDVTAPAVCSVNVVGGPDAAWPQSRLRSALAVPGVHVHLYGKKPRPGRKLGHVTAVADDHTDAARHAHAAADALMGVADHDAVAPAVDDVDAVRSDAGR